VVPRYFAQTHHLTIAASSTISAITMLAMIVGGIGTGLTLSRGMRTASLYAGIAVAGAAAGIFVYAPWVTLSFAVAGLVGWQLTTGAASAAQMALLPKVVQDPTRGAAASGLVGQVMAFTNFVTPPFYFRVLGEGNWRYFVVLVVACWFLSLVILPAWRGRVAERERVASLS